MIQTYQNMEILLIDDGFTDSCPQRERDFSLYQNGLILYFKYL